jgi:hypothetical protein
MNKLAEINIGETLLGKDHFLVKSSGLTGVGTLTSIIISNALVIAGIIVLFFLVAGGIGMISGAGQDNPEKAEKSKKTITSAIVGFVVIFAAYWIVQIIGKITGTNLLGL